MNASPAMVFELYLHPYQNSEGLDGFDLLKHLQGIRFIDRALSMNDEVVKGWISDPSTYPEEFKGKRVYLWKSRMASGFGGFLVFMLFWRDERVWVGSSHSSQKLCSDRPALLHRNEA